MTFGASSKRLLGMMRPERNLITFVVVISALATLGNALGPVILARGTDLIFNGALGGGIDFSALGTVILEALAVYVVSGLVLWWASFLINDIVQRTVYRMREQVADQAAPAADHLLRPAAPRRAAQPGGRRTSMPSPSRCSRPWRRC